uniref:Uncharacterized protein n=1 Tax=Brassica oleracea var. oleracea TaxID=109376 RepID=A0A0D2ZR32_BRAOL
MRSGFGNVSFESPVQIFPLLYKLRFSCQLYNKYNCTTIIINITKNFVQHVQLYN